jgi:hypothetical protein
VGSWLAWCGLVVTLGCSRGAPAPSRPATSGPAPSTSGTTANAARRPALTLADAENALLALNARDAQAEVRAHFMMRSERRRCGAAKGEVFALSRRVGASSASLWFNALDAPAFEWTLRPRSWGEA